MFRIAILILCSLLPSCKNNQKSKTDSLEADSAAVKSQDLGLGYDSIDGYYRKNCLVNTPGDFSKLGWGGYREANFNYSFEKKLKFNFEEMGSETSGKVDIKIAKASVDVNYYAQNMKTSLSHAVVTDFVYNAGTLYLKRVAMKSEFETLYDRITQAADQLEKNFHSAIAREECGDQFVDQMELGSKFSASMRISFADDNKLLDWLAKAKFKVAGISKSKEWEEYVSKEKTELNITVDAFQLGGDQAQFALVKSQFLQNATCKVRIEKPIEISESAWATDLKQKIDNQIKPCLDSYNAILQYASTSYYDQIKEANVSSPPLNRLGVLNIHHSSYDRIGLFALSENYPPDLLVIKRKIKEFKELLDKLVAARKSLEALGVEDWSDVADTEKQLRNAMKGLLEKALPELENEVKIALKECTKALVGKDAELKKGCSSKELTANAKQTITGLTKYIPF